MVEERYLNEKQVAKMFGLEETTLQQHRHKKVGFPYFKIAGCVRYRLSAINKHIADKMRLT